MRLNASPWVSWKIQVDGLMWNFDPDYSQPMSSLCKFTILTAAVPLPIIPTAPAPPTPFPLRLAIAMDTLMEATFAHFHGTARYYPSGCEAWSTVHGSIGGDVVCCRSFTLEVG
jgi:hypothetical protein